MENNRLDKAVEDEPQMRSVKLQSTLPLRFLPPPAIGRLSLASAKSRPSVPSSQGGSEVHAKNDLWIVNILKPLPSFYKLERTHVSISDACCGEVAQRIALCLKRESIKARYNAEEGSVEAETKDDVDFAINLFSSTGKIVVEVQRQKGCGFQFYETAKMVLRASKGMKKTKTPRRQFAIPSSLPKISEEEEKKNLSEGLEIVSKLVKSRCMDSQLMAIQSLEALSKCDKCNAFVADTLLHGPWLRRFVRLIECGRVDAEAEDEVVGIIEEKHCLAMRRLSVCIICNCLQVLKRAGKLQNLMEEKKECLLAEGLLSALVGDLRCSTERPHDACEAAKCLRHLCCACPEERNTFFDCDVLNAASIAHSTGVSTHEVLEDESHRLITEFSR